MKERRRRKLLAEPPASATGDIAFNLIIFFLVCASVQPDSGREQTLPRSEQQDEQQQPTENIEVQLTRDSVFLGDKLMLPADFPGNFREGLTRALSSATRQSDRVVVVKSKPETPYFYWITITEMIEQAGGVVTIQREEEQEVIIPGT
ncbi:MAG: biopolymer transporter ExbD [Pirellulaceae bacterium]|jgi:biopolymer transport protein ExbD|nr:biopolymer transporter ExbD [Pirellulaceae bacterium]